MYVSENKLRLKDLLAKLGDPDASNHMKHVISGEILCSFPPSLLKEVVEEYKHGWLGNIGNGCRIISRILQTL